ncbi:hypothetical protein HK405_010575 [Cladochytrium tenue]|nr:hypothetical protein HK405_010575 [Cladochytrium tenue]
MPTLTIGFRSVASGPLPASTIACRWLWPASTAAIVSYSILAATYAAPTRKMPLAGAPFRARTVCRGIATSASPSPAASTSSPAQVASATIGASAPPTATTTATTTAVPVAAAAVARTQENPLLVFSATSHIPATARVYVLPTLHARHAFHARLSADLIPPTAGPGAADIARSRPYNPVARAIVVLAFRIRQLRYDLWDRAVAAPWHRFGAAAVAAAAGARAGAASSAAAAVYRAGNRIGTRRAADEYFLKSLPPAFAHVEFIYPAGLSTIPIKEQLREFLAARQKHVTALFLYALILSATVFLAKILLPLANAILAYVAFRTVAHARALTAISNLRRCLDNPARTHWTPSQGLTRLVERRSREVEERLRDDARAAGGDPDSVWSLHWPASFSSSSSSSAAAAAPGAPRASAATLPRPSPLDGDLHDEVVAALEKDLRSAELARNYRRARMQYFVHTGRA